MPRRTRSDTLFWTGYRIPKAVSVPEGFSPPFIARIESLLAAQEECTSGEAPAGKSTPSGLSACVTIQVRENVTKSRLGRNIGRRSGWLSLQRATFSSDHETTSYLLSTVFDDSMNSIDYDEFSPALDWIDEACPIGLIPWEVAHRFDEDLELQFQVCREDWKVQQTTAWEARRDDRLGMFEQMLEEAELKLRRLQEEIRALQGKPDLSTCEIDLLAKRENQKDRQRKLILDLHDSHAWNRSRLIEELKNIKKVRPARAPIITIEWSAK